MTSRRMTSRSTTAPWQRPRALAGALALGAGAFVVATGAWGQGESGDAAQSPAPAASEAGPAGRAPAEGAAAGDQPEGRQAEGGQAEGMPEEGGRRVSDDVFIPTEEIAADDEITFPVDI